MSNTQLVSVSRDNILQLLALQSFDFLAAVSFEERSTAWAQALSYCGLRPMHTILFDYNTLVDPEADDRELRKKCRDIFNAMFFLDNNNLSVCGPINAFAVNQLTQLTTRLITDCTSNYLLVDISCMTRVHLVALSNALRSVNRKPGSVLLCYTTPQSYSFQKEVLHGWKDTLFVPIGELRSFRREGHARGVAFPGHYGERLGVALQEIEPDSGILIYTRQEGRTDLLRCAKEVNKFIAKRLLLLRMPRADGFNSSTSPTDCWRSEVVNIDDFGRLHCLIEEEVNSAIYDGGPIMMYPFGPKPVTLFATLSLASYTNVQSCVVYPLPEKFDAQYSSGIGQLHCYSLESL